MQMTNESESVVAAVAARWALPGSTRTSLLAGSAEVAQVPAAEEIQVTLVLRRRNELPVDLSHPISRVELEHRYGADPGDIEVVVNAVVTAGAVVVSTDAASRRIRLSGPVAVLESLFGTQLMAATTIDQATGTQVRYRARQGGLSVPAVLQEIVTAVLGLDDRPQARARMQFAAAAVSHSYTPLDLGAIYKFPASTDGTGQHIAIIELGGGFAQSELDTYFTGLGLKSPKVIAIGVDGATNIAGADPQGADGEVLLDIEVVGALAPAAQILVYFAPNTDAGFLDAVSEAAHANPTPAAISISWGQSEDQWTAQARRAMDSAFADAAALGTTVTVAAGDDGSTDRVTDGKAHCDFPASSPHVLACGGTSLHTDAGTTTVSSETVWNNGSGNGSTGGGVSDAFVMPTWQRGAGVPVRSTGKSGRGVPDVSADADPQTGYSVLIDGTRATIGGTSAVAPLWAALAARLSEALGRPLGLLAPTLYQGIATGVVQPGFRDITIGNNGRYQAGAGWDACTGLGVPDGEALLVLLRG